MAWLSTLVRQKLCFLVFRFIHCPIAAQGQQRYFPTADKRKAIDLSTHAEARKHNFQPGVSLSKFRAVEATLASANAGDLATQTHSRFPPFIFDTGDSTVRGLTRLEKTALVEKVYVCDSVRVIQPIEPPGPVRCESKDKLMPPIGDSQDLLMDPAICYRCII